MHLRNHCEIAIAWSIIELNEVTLVYATPTVFENLKPRQRKQILRLCLKPNNWQEHGPQGKNEH
jgi:hypothetical protein